jgi:hypothetical protein
MTAPLPRTYQPSGRSDVSAVTNALRSTTELTLVGGQSQFLSDASIGSSSTRLRFQRGSGIMAAVNTTTTVDGAIDAGPWQIFFGLGSFRFGPNAPKEIEVAWFGTGIAALQAAHDAAYDDAVLRLPDGGLTLTSSPTFTKSVTLDVSRGPLAVGYGASVTLNAEHNGRPTQQVFDTSAGGGAELLFGPLGPQVATGEHFGAAGDGFADDGPAMRAALKAFRGRAFGTLRLNASSYLIHTAAAPSGSVSSGGLVVDCDNITVEGPGSGKCTLVTDPGASDDWFIPLLAQKWTTGDLEPTRIYNLQLRGFQILWSGAGPNSTGSQLGTLQLNRVSHATIDDVTVAGAVLGMNGSHVDGFAFAWETDDVQIDGRAYQMSKVGVYLAQCTNIRGSVHTEAGQWTGQEAAGVQISSSRNVDLLVQSHDNNGNGVIVSNEPYATATVANLSNQTHFDIVFSSQRSHIFAAHLGVLNTTSKRIEELSVLSATDSGDHLTWHIVLNTAPAQTISNTQVLNTNYVPTKHVTVRGEVYNHSADAGVVIQSGLDGSPLEGVIVDVHAHDNYRGLQARSFDGLIVRGRYVGNTNAGVVLADRYVFGDSSIQDIGRRTTIDAVIGDNGVAGVYATSITDLVIAPSCIIYRSSAGAQTSAVLLSADGNGKRPTGLRVGRFHHPGYANTELVSPQSGTSADMPTDTASQFDFFDGQTPEAHQYGTPGSTALDASTGDFYLKTTAGTLKTGWARVYQANDAATAATANKLVLRNGSGDVVGAGGTFSGAVTGASVAAAGNVTGQYIVTASGFGLIATTGSYSIQWGVGGTLTLNEFGGAIIASMAASSIQWNVATANYTKALAVAFTQDPLTSAGNGSTWTWTGQSPHSGDGGNGGGFRFQLAAGDGAGAYGSFLVRNAGDAFKVNGTGLGFFGSTPVARPTVTGALLSVTDANAKAVLTSIIAALKASGLGLIADGTT